MMVRSTPSTLVWMLLWLPIPGAWSDVRIWEVAPRGTPGFCDNEDWIELYNVGAEAFDLEGYRLADSQGPDDEDAYLFGSELIPAGGFVTICREDATGGSVSPGFKFGIGTDDSISLWAPGAQNASDSYEFAALENPSASWIRIVHPAGHVYFDHTSVPTPGSENVASRKCRNVGVCDCIAQLCGGWGWSSTHTRCMPGSTTTTQELERGFCGQDKLLIEFEGSHVMSSSEKGEYFNGYQYTINKLAGVVEIINLDKPKFPVLAGTINTSTIGIPASIDISAGYIAVGINSNSQLPGHIAIYEKKRGSPVDLQLVFTAEICTGPGEVLFNPAGNSIVVMCEGEFDPLNTTNDPDGGVGIFTYAAGSWTGPQMIPYDGVEATPGLRGVEGAPNETTHTNRDLEPEFGDFSANGNECYIVFQENNVMGVLSIPQRRWVRWWSFGSKPAQAFDGSDKDEKADIRIWPEVRMLFAPDTIRMVTINGIEYVVSVNEGDSRDSEQARLRDLDLDPDIFADDISDNDNLGRLKVSSVANENDLDNNGLVDTILAFGGRSISIWDTNGTLVWDSGATINFEYLISHRIPYNHNSDRNGVQGQSFDARSDEQGPEPDSMAIGEISNRTYAFVGIERAGGIVAIDISDPTNASFAGYTRHPLEIAPERTDFVPSTESTIGKALLISTGERSPGSNVYTITPIGASAQGDQQSDNDDHENTISTTSTSSGQDGITSANEHEEDDDDRLSGGAVAGITITVGVISFLCGVFANKVMEKKHSKEQLTLQRSNI